MEAANQERGHLGQENIEKYACQSLTGRIIFVVTKLTGREAEKMELLAREAVNSEEYTSWEVTVSSVILRVFLKKNLI